VAAQSNCLAIQLRGTQIVTYSRAHGVGLVVLEAIRYSSPRTEYRKWYAARLLEVVYMLKFRYLMILLLEILAHDHSAQSRGKDHCSIHEVSMLPHRSLTGPRSVS
jgi:hypothetical protein